jgi:LPS export ABC transporter protein LptC
VTLAAGGCGSADSSSRPSDRPSGPAIAIQTGTLAHYGASGQLVWSLTAAAVHYDRGTEESRAQDAQVRFMRPDSAQSPQTPSLTVRADRLVFEHRTRNLVLRDGVRGDGSEGLTFETDRAHWDAEQRRLTGRRPVTIRREDLTMRGTGFTYDLQSQSLSLQSASLQVQLGGAR